MIQEALASLAYWFYAGGWKVVLALAGLAVMGATTYTLVSGIVQAQPAFTQAIQITAYVIPVMAYTLVFQFIFQVISMMREMFKRGEK